MFRDSEETGAWRAEEPGAAIEARSDAQALRRERVKRSARHFLVMGYLFDGKNGEVTNLKTATPRQLYLCRGYAIVTGKTNINEKHRQTNISAVQRSLRHYNTVITFSNEFVTLRHKTWIESL
jgi:hypothetical protein